MELHNISACDPIVCHMRSGRDRQSNSCLILDVRNYIKQHYDDPNLSLVQLSDAFDIHVKTLSRMFKEEIGENFVDYVARIRVDQAKRLLAGKSVSIQDVGVRVGYIHTFSFIRLFKKVVGMTPGDYRRIRKITGMQELKL